jgi:hypothetical protein
VPESLESRVAVLADNAARIFNELVSVRANLDTIATDRATLLILTRAVEDLKENLPRLARQSAREAVTEMARRQRADTLSNWRTYAALVGAGTALGALIIGLILR